MRRVLIPIAWIYVCVLGAGGCAGTSTNGVDRDGTDASAPQEGVLAIVGVGEFEDRRKGGRDGWNLSTDTESAPLGKPEFESAVSEALERRGLLAASGKELYEISGDVLEPTTSRSVFPQITIRIRIRVSSLRGGAPLFSSVYQGHQKLDGIPLWHATVKEKMGEAEAAALAKAVAAAIDDPRLRRVLVY